jgi:inhibitor of growth protein 5
VDKHIRRLDADLARFENELKGKLEVSGYESPEARGLKSKLGTFKTVNISRQGQHNCTA